MKKLILVGSLCFCLFTSMIAINKVHAKKEITYSTTFNYSITLNTAESYWIDSLYANMHLSDAGLSHTAFFDACKGYEYLLSQNNLEKQGIITICDFSQPSNKKRLYVLNLNTQKILFNTYVSHGRNSGNDYATSFSNNNDSYKSCLGFMVTAETYIGEHGCSLRLDGTENGFNDNVRSRSIVMHGSDYVCRERALNGTMMGRSFGCPAVPAAEVKKIIDSIKDGSCFFNFYPDKYYTQNSKILNADFIWPAVRSMQLASIKVPDTLNSFTPDPVN